MLDDFGVFRVLVYVIVDDTVSDRREVACEHTVQLRIFWPEDLIDEAGGRAGHDRCVALSLVAIGGDTIPAQERCEELARPLVVHGELPFFGLFCFGEFLEALCQAGLGEGGSEPFTVAGGTCEEAFYFL